MCYDFLLNNVTQTEQEQQQPVSRSASQKIRGVKKQHKIQNNEKQVFLSVDSPKDQQSTCFSFCHQQFENQQLIGSKQFVLPSFQDLIRSLQ